jgi:hypothetical protein
MELAELIEKLAKILAGLQVPLSIGGPTFLGAAYEPYREILNDEKTFGYRQSEDFEAYLRRKILEATSVR